MQDSLKKVFNDKCIKCGDVVTEERWWEIFYFFYGNKDKDIPVSNPWTLDLGNW